MNPVIKIKNLTISYNGHKALENVGFTVLKGIRLGIVGPNGAGKSTLIKAMLGLLTPKAGKITIKGHKPNQARKIMAYVPQREEIDWDFPVSVLDTVLMGRYAHLGWTKRLRPHDYRVARNALSEVGLEELENKQIGNLSGGQKQRVFLARALAQRAEIMLLDEPFSGVDQKTEKMIFDLLEKDAEKGKTILVVHHDLKKLEKYFDELLLINRQIIASGPAGSVLTPQHLKLAYEEPENKNFEQNPVISGI